MAGACTISKALTGSDAFLDMPLSSQALYFHLAGEADDDGFLNCPKRVQRAIGASGADLALLVEEGFLLPIDGGAVLSGCGEGA